MSPSTVTRLPRISRPAIARANAKLLSDKLIKSHEIFLACTSAGAGNAPEKEEFHGVV